MKKFECPDFVLGDKITDEQYNFFDKYGVIIFRNFLRSETVQLFIDELNRIEKQWLDEGREKVNGIPLKFGKDQNGNKMIQRMCFLFPFTASPSMTCCRIRAFKPVWAFSIPSKDGSRRQRKMA